MAFPESVVQQAWERAGGKCECRRKKHGHDFARCDKDLVWDNKGREGQGKWEAHHISESGSDVLSNCEILCGYCHSLTF